MTLAQQFPDASMSNRRTHKLNLKKDSSFREVAFSADQKFYDREFRHFHIKVIAFIVLSLTVLFFLVFNAPKMLKWIAS